MDPFIINVNGQALDYRQPAALTLKPIYSFFSKDYTVANLWQEGRHVLGWLEKNNRHYFLKLATTPGISAVTQIEARWNHEYNQRLSRATYRFWVPQNYEQGYYQNLFFLITDRFVGQPLADLRQPSSLNPNLPNYFASIIEFSEIIQTLDLPPLADRDHQKASDSFIQKINSWFHAVPDTIRRQYQLSGLLDLVQTNYHRLRPATRHGDFTPWHLLLLNNGAFGLIDGEHAMANGIELYDIGYFIQRLFSVLHQPQRARQLFHLLIKRHYDPNLLQIILAARAIGGFLDESLAPSPNYAIHDEFQHWVIHGL